MVLLDFFLYNFLAHVSLGTHHFYTPRDYKCTRGGYCTTRTIFWVVFDEILLIGLRNITFIGATIVGYVKFEAKTLNLASSN